MLLFSLVGQTNDAKFISANLDGQIISRPFRALRLSQLGVALLM